MAQAPVTNNARTADGVSSEVKIVLFGSFVDQVKKNEALIRKAMVYVKENRYSFHSNVAKKGEYIESVAKLYDYERKFKDQAKVYGQKSHKLLQKAFPIFIELQDVLKDVFGDPPKFDFYCDDDAFYLWSRRVAPTPALVRQAFAPRVPYVRRHRGRGLATPPSSDDSDSD